MNYKKYASLSAAVILMLSSFSGCGADSSDSSETGSSVKSQAESQQESQENTQAPDIEGYSLLWNDEFETSELDMTKWNYEPHEPGWTNNELQEYTESTDNVFIRDGKLVIKALKSEDLHYTSGKVTGQNKTDFTYGKVCVSAKVPEGQGLWPAIWMMPKEEEHYGQWPKCGEIDIMEVLGSDTSVAYGTVHYGEPHAEQQKIYTLDNSKFSDDFHEYSVEWEPGEMRWYIDGNLYQTVNDWFTAVEGEDEKPYPAPFDQPFFVQLNLAVGGTWPGNPDETTDFDKAEFEVDYVRVYQKPEYDTNVQKPEKEFRQALEDGNFVYNGDFAEAEDLLDEDNWRFLLFEGGEGSAEIKDNTIVVTTEKQGTVDYSVQLVQADMPMINGKKYRLTFDAWTDKDRAMKVCVSAPTAGWVRYLPDTVVKMTTERTTYTYDFEMTYKDDNNGRVEFNMGHMSSTASVNIADVRLEEITNDEQSSEDTAAEE